MQITRVVAPFFLSAALAACHAAGTVGHEAEGESPPAEPVPQSIQDALDRGIEARWLRSTLPLEAQKVEPERRPDPPPIDTDILSHLPTGQTQLNQVCARGLDNAVTNAFCGATPPQLTGLEDLQRTMQLQFVDPEQGNGQNGNPGFAITGHSTSLVTRSVSAINPRTIVFTRDRNRRDDENLVVMGYTRGDQFAEIAVSAPAVNDEPAQITFYLVKYTQACNAIDSCNWGDKLTPETERNWTGWTLYQDEDLKNSVVDCLQCHQPDGPGTQRIFRMQELQNPWTHWFRDNRDGGQALIADFQATHGTTESYGGVPAALISDSDPARLEDFVRDSGFDLQPNEFLTSTIEDEVVDSNQMQPDLNMPPGESTTWMALYEEAVRANTIPVPYHDVKITDPAKLAFMSDAYIAHQEGRIAKGELPDIRQVFLEEALPKMSMRPRPGLSGREIITHMCGQCHNSRLDQNITRARFNAITLESMSREAKDLAIARVLRSDEDRFRMPPTLFRDLSLQEKALVVEELSK